MDKIKLFDTTTYEIEDGASLDRVIINAKTSAKAAEAAAAFTPENLQHVEFLHGSETAGIYDDLGLTPAEEGGSNPTIDGATVTISLYQK
jgi:hypothetical protein